MGTIPAFQNKIAKIYKDTAFADILKELLQLEADRGGKRNIYIDCKNGSLNILNYQREPYLSALIANSISVSSHDTINNVKVSKSIQEMKNRVVYTDNNEKSVYSVIADDAKNISSYGLLQTVEKVDTNKENNLSKLAKDKLNELNKITEKYELSLIGDYKISKGKLVDFKISKYNIDDSFIIKSASHNIDSCKETVNITMDIYKSPV